MNHPSPGIHYNVQKVSSTGTTVTITTANYLSGSQAPWMLPVIPCFVLPPVNFNGGRFSTKICLSTSKISFVNINNVWWYVTLVGSDGCADKYLYVDGFSTSLYLHDFVALLYCNIISQSHIILSRRCHITNLYCKKLDCRLCTTWGTLASDSNNFCIPLKYDSIMNSSSRKYFLNFPMAHLTTDDSNTKLCLDFYSGNTVDI